MSAEKKPSSKWKRNKERERGWGGYNNKASTEETLKWTIIKLMQLSLKRLFTCCGPECWGFLTHRFLPWIYVSSLFTMDLRQQPFYHGFTSAAFLPWIYVSSLFTMDLRQQPCNVVSQYWPTSNCLRNPLKPNGFSLHHIHSKDGKRIL